MSNVQDFIRGVLKTPGIRCEVELFGGAELMFVFSMRRVVRGRVYQIEHRFFWEEAILFGRAAGEETGATLAAEHERQLANEGVT